MNNQIIGQYRQILEEDGQVDKDDLINMLKADEEIDGDYDKLAERILNYKKRKKKFMQTKDTNKERYEMYRKGYSDVDIAKKQGVCTNTIWQWRNTRNLPPNKSLREERKKRLVLWEQGLTDQEIADAVGTTLKIIKSWRNRNKLKANKKEQEQPINDIEKRIEMANAGMTAKQIAEKECVSTRTIETYLYRRKKCSNVTSA